MKLRTFNGGLCQSVTQNKYPYRCKKNQHIDEVEELNYYPHEII